MLVLSRRLNEKLLIPSIRTAIQVLSIQGGQVRLGVEAPKEVAVFREEIYKTEPENQELIAGAAAPRDRLPGLLRNRLAGLALGLDRLQGQLAGDQLAPAAQAALDRLGDEFDELARLVNGLLDESVRPTKRPLGCAR